MPRDLIAEIAELQTAYEDLGRQIAEATQLAQELVALRRTAEAKGHPCQKTLPPRSNSSDPKSSA